MQTPVGPPEAVAPEALHDEMVLHPNEIKRQSQQLPHAKITINQSAAHMNFTGLCVVSVSNFNQAMAHINAHQLYTERGSLKWWCCCCCCRRCCVSTLCLKSPSWGVEGDVPTPEFNDSKVTWLQRAQRWKSPWFSPQKVEIFVSSLPKKDKEKETKQTITTLGS